MVRQKKLSKIKTINCKVNESKQALLTAEQREERVQYFVDLFRLTFRAHLSFTNSIIKDKNVSLDEYYDDFVDSESGLGGTEDEMEDFRADFKTLNAEDRFIQCCIDYYQDVIVELNSSLTKLTKELKTLTDQLGSMSSFEQKKKRWIKNQCKSLEERVELTQKEQTQVDQKLKALRQELKNLQTKFSKDELIKN